MEKKSQSPLYQQLMTRLKNDIRGRASIPAGGRIPSEQVLCDTYGVSRVTVRKAMLDLVQEGLLVRQSGQGHLCGRGKDSPGSEHDHQLYRFLRGPGASCGSTAHFLSVGGTDGRGLRKLGVAPDGRVLELCRLRLCDGDPVMLEVNRFPEEYAFLADEPVEGSLYEFLRAHGVIPSSAIHDISMGHATPFVSKHLHTEVGDALLVLDELVLNQHGEPLHLSRQWIRGDKYTFRI